MIAFMKSTRIHKEHIQSKNIHMDVQPKQAKSFCAILTMAKKKFVKKAKVINSIILSRYVAINDSQNSLQIKSNIKE